MNLKLLIVGSATLVLLIGIDAIAASCPKCKPCSKHCPPGQRPVYVTHSVCKPHPSGHCGGGGPHPRPKLGSLGFVIDDTGSMGDDIAGVRARISDIMAGNKMFRDYMVARFGDPYKRRLLHSANPAAVRRFINAIRPSKGGDCPEYSMSGIRDAANAARPRSVLYLFTDASAKDARLKSAVAALLRRKKTRLYVVRSGNLCGKAYKGEYDYLAKASGGSVIKLSSKAQVKLVMRYIGLASAGRVPFKLPSTVAKLTHIKPGCCRFVGKYICKKHKGGICPRGYRRVVKRRRICPSCGGGCPGPHPHRLGSLGFVIDVTGSMGTEIFSVKSSIGSVVAANRRFKNYVLATFGDPYKRQVSATTKKSAVLQFLKSIHPSGGGDCPEFSLSGVRDAASSALPRSVLFLFTDASAKDANLKLSVAALLKRKKTRLFIVKTGNLCGSAYKGEYDYLAKASGGKVISLTSKEGVASVMNFMKMAVAGKTSFSAIPKTLEKLKKFKPKRGAKCYTEILITCRRSV